LKSNLEHTLARVNYFGKEMTNDYKKFVAETFLQENQPKSRIIDTKNPNALLYILRNK